MLDSVKNFLWNFMFIPLFLITGAVCFVMIIKNRGAKRIEGKEEGEVSPIQTLFVTLASTIGTGNIVGVSLAISVGGPGSVFWMWVAALFGMCVSYCENALGKIYKSDIQPVGYMPRAVSGAFAFFCIITSVGIGNMIQSNSAAGALYTGFGIDKGITGILFAIMVFIIIKGGIRGITKFTDFFVPVMSVFFVVSALAVIIINRENVPGVFRTIFTEAFSLRAIGGGALANGIARGVMSGEAGVGSTVILSSKSSAKSPHRQGMIGATAIFIDTIVMCTLTAVAILSAGTVSTQTAFYSTLGAAGGKILDIAITFFAFTTIVGWSYFGLECTGYLFGEKKKNWYKLFYAVAVFAGAVIQLEIVWAIGDISCALMALPNLGCVLFYASNIRSNCS